MTEAERYVRQTLVDTMPRQQVIEAIVKHIQRVANWGNSEGNGTPNRWYAAPFGARTRNGGLG